MVAKEWDEPHRPTAPSYPGTSYGPPGPMAHDQDQANKLFAYHNAKLLERQEQQADKDHASVDEIAAGPGRYQALNSEHDARAAEVAARVEEIKKDHGVRLAGDLHQRGVTDGMMVGGTINAFANTAASNGMQSADVGAMAVEDYDKALTAAAVQAESERQVASPGAEAAAETQAGTGTPSAAASPVAPEAAATHDAGASASDAREARLQRLAPEAAAESSDLNAFREAGGEMTDSRAARQARLNDLGGSGPDSQSPSPDGPTPSSPGLGE